MDQEHFDEFNDLGHKNKVLTGGENVLYRHDKTFVNKTIIQ